MCILIGITHSLHHFLIPHFLEDKNYNYMVIGNNISYTIDETAPYGAYIREVVDGNFFSNDPYDYEAKYRVFGNQQRIPVYYIAFFAWIFGGDIEKPINSAIFYLRFSLSSLFFIFSIFQQKEIL